MFLSVCCLSLLIGAGDARAEAQYAGKQRSTVAKAHMSRARTLLVEALEEFEEARKYARPDLLLDSEDFRLRVISLTEQLNRVIDPRPRITREGAVFRVPPRLVKREKDNLPIVSDGAKSRSDFGERDRMESKQRERARLFNSGSNKEPMRVAKNNTSKTNIPQELEIPSEPELNIDHSDPTKNRGPLNEKALFTEELMPQIQANKDREAARQHDLENRKVEIEEELVDPKLDGKTSEDVDIIEEETTPSKQVAPVDSNVVEEIDDEESLLKDEPIENPSVKALRENLQADYEDEAGKKVVNEIPKPEANLGIDGQISEDDLAPEEARKQLSEDEELAKRLEDTVYDRINSGK